METIKYLSKDGKTTINASLWRPEGKPKGIVQIIHGMSEYGSRYAPFAEVLAEAGFLVGADDHLGHGESVTGPNNLGYFCEGDSVGVVLGDLRTFSLKLREIEPDAPFFLLGHSMGSFFTRAYISMYGTEYAGAVIMGTGFMGGVTTGAAKFLTHIVSIFQGKKGRSRFINNLAFGSYNKKWRPERTAYDWLSQITQTVDKYISDPLCGFLFTCNGFLTLFKIISKACKKATFLATPKSLPIYLVSGADDPVGAYGKGVERVYDKYTAAGVEDLSMTLYRGARHEILNDNCSIQVEDDILEFLREHIK